MKNIIIRFAATVFAGSLFCTVSCGEVPPPDVDPDELKSITIGPSGPHTVMVGHTVTLTAVAEPSTASLANLRWSSRNPEFASVEQGVVKCVGAGEATIVATCGEVKETCVVNVIPAPVALKKIEIVPASLSLKTGGTTTLSANLIPVNADVDGVPVWKSLDPDIADVNQNGLVTAKTEGRATITATIGEVSGKCSVGVYTEATERSLTFFQLNLWEGLGNVDNGVEALINHLVALKPDVASFCEFRSADEARTVLSRATAELKTRTGISYDFTYRSGSGTRGLLTRHPVLSTGTVGEGGGNVWFYRTTVDFYGREIALYSSHSYHSYYACYLPRGYGDGENPYGWNKIADGPVTDLDFIMEREAKSGREKIAEAMVADMAVQKAAGRLCIFGGDLNQPSHLDWTAAAKDSYEHNGCVVPWSVSTICYANGIRDAFREIHPDPVTRPGVTWPVYNKDAKKVTQWAAGADERDRIDYVYFKQDADIAAVKAQMVGPLAMISHSVKVEDTFVDKAEELIEPVNGLWPSDHRGILITFTVNFGE